MDGTDIQQVRESDLYPAGIDIEWRNLVSPNETREDCPLSSLGRL